MNKFKLYALIAAILLVLVIIFQNAQVVTLRVLFWNTSLSGILLFLILLMMGFVAGYVLASMRRRQ